MENEMSPLRETEFGKVLQKHWNKLKTHTKYYPNVEMWWERNVKRRLRQLFTRAGAEGRCDRIATENFYYEAIYNISTDSSDH